MRALVLVFGLAGTLFPVGANAAGPTELPPLGYKGTMFVDSQGCAFAKATINGSVTWVQRLDTARQPICDENPTLASADRVVVTSPVAVSVAPKSVKKTTKPHANNENIPQGYRAAWTDDRLNPNRGPRTAEGDASMYQVWTDSVPMRLIRR